MERVNVGMHVDIRRSDGRVHNAVISEVRKDMLSVTVEWFENGETKGKEIDLKALLAINPTLAAPPPSTPMSSLANDENRMNATGIQPRQQQNNNTVVNGNVTSSLDVTGSVVKRATRLPRTRPSSAYGRRTFMGSSSAVGGSTGSFTTNGNAEASSTAMDTTISTTTTTASSIPPPVIRAAAPSSVSQPVRMVQPQAVKPPRFVLDPSNYNVDDIVNETITSTSSSKSSTVQEIERLQRNREERRAHQVEVKKQKEQLRSIDPGNPNWQFLTMIREYQSKIDFRPLNITDQVTDNRITVCVRKRPLNRKEIMRKEVEVITIPNRDHVIVHQPQVKVDLTKYLENQKFRFDYTFDENSTNEMVYRFTAQPLLKTIFQQGVATCFAYGQTGSGKTHTMGGTFNGKAQDCAKGIYALTASDVFKMLGKEYRNENLQVGCSFFEIYGGKVFDLVSNKAMLRVLEDGKSQVQIVGLQEVIVSNEKEVLEIISKGMDIRTAGVTSANSNSSRSHAVFQIVLRKKPNKSSQVPGRMWGKFSLIDLAGNERGVDTISSDTQTRMEGAEINKSLLALKECIRAMGRNTSHVPFRQSKLTLVLRDSFIGSNAKTCMIAMISPGMSSCEHTLNTLRYADRVKELGAEEGASTPLDDEQLMLADDGTDLEMTRSRNGMSEEAYREQKALQDIAAAEERCIDELATTVESNPHAMLVSLMAKSSKVDYDMLAFANELMRAAGNYRDQAIRLYECADKLQTELRRDEAKSKERNSTKRH